MKMNEGLPREYRFGSSVPGAGRPPQECLPDRHLQDNARLKFIWVLLGMSIYLKWSGGWRIRVECAGMRNISTFIIAFVFFCLASSAQDSVSSLGLVKGKRLLIRNFYSDKEIQYAANGVVQVAHPGVWLLDGYFEIESAAAFDGELVLKGKRQFGIFGKNGSLGFLPRKDSVTIRLQGVPTNKDVLTKIFVQDDEPLLAVLPAYWGPFFDRKPTATKTQADVGAVEKADGKTVKAPQLKQTFEPIYPKPSRDAKISGTVVLNCVVGEDGVVRDITIVRPLGAGLDEKAIEALQKWRFWPATKNGHPVAAYASIEIEFDLF